MSGATERCAYCRKYLDGLTDDAEPHPHYPALCIPCGTRTLAADRAHGIPIYEVHSGRKVE